jgi:post-segregation antitoxin (ccd killing protein)
VERIEQAREMGFEVNVSGLAQAAVKAHLSKLAGLIFEANARRKGITAEQLLWIGYGVREPGQAGL